MLHFTLKHTMPAAFSLLPERMDSPEARTMLLAIGLQESRFEYRKQIGGPARGFWQFEEGGGVRGVLNHPASSNHAARACGALQYAPVVPTVYFAIADNDVLALCFARLLLFTLPKPLPRRGDWKEGFDQYLQAWRPGRPRPDTWRGFFERSWEAVDSN